MTCGGSWPGTNAPYFSPASAMASALPAHTDMLVLCLRLLCFLLLIFLNPGLIPKPVEVLALTLTLHSTSWGAAPGYFLAYSITHEGHPPQTLQHPHPCNASPSFPNHPSSTRRQHRTSIPCTSTLPPTSLLHPDTHNSPPVLHHHQLRGQV